MTKRVRSQHERLAAAQASGSEHAQAEALLALAEMTPLFNSQQDRVLEWVARTRDLAQRVVLSPRAEILHVQLQAEALLGSGSPREGFQVAREACRIAARARLPGLEDRAWLVEARCMVRLRRQDDAVRLFQQVIDRSLAEDEEEPVVPGLAFLALGEAHLFEGRYDGAYRPLELAIARLPAAPYADRLRYDALVGLGLLDHRLGDFEAAGLRYAAAASLADAHQSTAEQVESLLLIGSLARGRGDQPVARVALEQAVALSAEAALPLIALNFPTERLRNLMGYHSGIEMLEACITLARDCGSEGDLMGYVQLTAIAAALTDLVHGVDAARALLTAVNDGLTGNEYSTAAAVVARHLDGYGLE
ncbi:MAG: tetratricopeptide (TPR) repeat protein [Myxococcota bacterium]|jgi:tetratricopeptide (TPR) repeat protein